MISLVEIVEDIILEAGIMSIVQNAIRIFVGDVIVLLFVILVLVVYLPKR